MTRASDRGLNPGDLDYRAAGVDIDAGDALVRAIGSAVRRTHSERVLRGLGHFGGFYRVGPAGEGTTLVASVDGVGTKVKLASLTRDHGGIGHDIVNHCVNDILACGARPICFLDYFATGSLDVDVARTVIEGIAAACERHGIALLGGETAEMPGVYQGDDYDVAGVIIGLVDAAQIVDGTSIRAHDVVIGLPSNGFHTNGYSLVRTALGLNEGDERRQRRILDARLPWDASHSIGDDLLKPHRSYLADVSQVQGTGAIRGMAHITGGGIAGNLGRVIPDGLVAALEPGRWEVPPIMSYVAELGNIPDSECFRVFNMGIGFVLVCEPDSAEEVLGSLEDALVIGKVIQGESSERVRLNFTE